MKGVGVDDSLTEIVCSRTNQELQETPKHSLREVYKTGLEMGIVSNTSGDFHKLMVALTKVEEREYGSVADDELTDQDSRYLYDAGVKRKKLMFPRVPAS